MSNPLCFTSFVLQTRVMHLQQRRSRRSQGLMQPAAARCGCEGAGARLLAMPHCPGDWLASHR